MTPLHIDIMLHYNIGDSDYRDGDFSAPAVREFVQDLITYDLLERFPQDEDCKFKCGITEKGRAWINGLCQTPMPVQKWVMP